MLGYALRRVLTAIPIVLLTITVCFFILRLAPGGPFDGERALPPDQLRNIRAYYHLDEPLVMQFLRYIVGVAQGNFDPSMVMKDFTVARLIGIGLPFTLMLGFSAFIVGTTAGLVAGAVAAVNQNRWPDYLLVFVVLIPIIIPNFLMANVAQLVFGVYLHWLPVGGYTPGAWINLVLPVLILALPHGARVARLTRGSMIEVLGTNYIRTARSKGLGARLILARHALKPALIPVVSYLGPGLSYLLTGSLVVEQVFALPGIGKYFITAALNRDYGVVLGTTILYVFIILALNLIVDVVYAWLDPKVRYR